MATLSKHSLSKQAKSIAPDADSLKKTALRARKVAQEQAEDARKYAKAWSKQAEKQTRSWSKEAGKQSRKARHEAEQRREELMEKIAAGAGIAMSVAPVVAKAVMSNKKARKRAARTATMSAARLNPLMLGVTAAGAGFVGYKMWKKRKEAALEESSSMASLDDPTPLQHERMDSEGPVPGGYEPTALRISRN